MSEDWLLLGYRIVHQDRNHLADRWGANSFISASEAMVDIFPRDNDWYAQEGAAFDSWLHAPTGCLL
jgi:hypothetical protein